MVRRVTVRQGTGLPLPVALLLLAATSATACGGATRHEPDARPADIEQGDGPAPPACPDCSDDVRSTVLAIAGYSNEQLTPYAMVADGKGGAFVTGAATSEACPSDTYPSGQEAFVGHMAADGSISILACLITQGYADVFSTSIALAPDGDLVVAGTFEGTLEVGYEMASSIGWEDAFVARVDATGKARWLWTLGGKSRDECLGITVDREGSVYATGAFHETASTGDLGIGSSGGSDIFVAKIAADGHGGWLFAAGGEMFDRGLAVAARPGGGAYVAGEISHRARFYPHTLHAKARGDMFIIRVSGDGKIWWARRAGGPGRDEATALATDAAGAVYAVGTFERFMDIESRTLLARGEGDVALLKLDQYGKLHWARALGGEEEDQVWDVTVDANGPVLAGAFRGQLTVGDISIGSRGDSDALVAAFSADGRARWVTRAGGIGDDSAYELIVDPDGSLTVKGAFRGCACFGQATLTTTHVYESFTWRLRWPFVITGQPKP